MQHVAHALFHRRDIVARDHAAHDFVHELKAGSARQRLDAQPAVTILAAAARLLLEFALCFGATLDGFLIGHPRRRQLDFYAEFSLQFFDRDLDVKLAGAAEDDFAALRIAMHLQREVLIDQLLQRRRRLSPRRALDLGRMANDMTAADASAVGSNMIGAFSSHSVSPVEVSLSFATAAISPGERDRESAPASCPSRRRKLPEAFFRFSRRIEHRRIAMRGARHDAEEGQLAGKGIHHRLEHECGKRRVGICGDALSGSPLAGFWRSTGGTFIGRGQQIDDRIEERRGADIFCTRAA